MRFKLSLLAFAVLPISSFATTAPDAGQSIRGIEQTPLELPRKQTLDLNLPDAPSSAVKTDGPTLQVSSFLLSGNTAIADHELLALLVNLQGREVSLGELQVGANRITRLYRERGYPLARAYLPAQEIDAGIVKIAVLEGQYGEVRVLNNTRLRPSALASLQTLKPAMLCVLHRWSAVCYC